MIEPGGPFWPAALGELREAPVRRLYSLGDPTVLCRPPGRFVAIVGTREATSYGIRVARALGRAFAEAGAVVVSGMARGVDSAAHEGALEAGGATVAVLGTGVDVPYPVGNRGLHQRIVAKGLVLSESPAGMAAFKGCFPRRNRIIAGLARLTIVVEAGFKSGALNTASQAMLLGRLVGCIPGPIDSPRSAGSNQFIRDGAQILPSVADALALLELSQNKAAGTSQLGWLEAELWDKLGEGDWTVDGLAAAIGAPVRDVLDSATRLELKGLVSTRPGGGICRVVLESARA